MVCRKLAVRSMLVVRFVGIKPLHPIGVRRSAYRGRLWEKCAYQGASLWSGVVSHRNGCTLAGVGFLQGTKTGRVMAVFDKSAFMVVRKTMGKVCAHIDTQKIGQGGCYPWVKSSALLLCVTKTIGIMIEVTIIIACLALCKKVYPYFETIFGKMK